ncbi:MAG: enoyl-CoA hydratase/isomerase family protein [Planctomycetota bacterium]
MTEPRTLRERRDTIAVITLNAPERRNAIDLEMVESLHRDLDALQDEKDLGAVVLTGAGEKAFAAGADIAQLKERDASDALKGINSTIFGRIEEFPTPIIAAVRGFCLGGGCELAIACDLRVGGEGAKFGQPEVGLGIMPAAGGTYRLPRLIGLGRARDLVYTGRILEAKEAFDLGLIEKLVPDDQVLQTAIDWAEQIAKNGPLAVRAAKRSMNALARPNQAQAGALESSLQASLFESEDKHRRMQAFLDRKNKKK